MATTTTPTSFEVIKEEVKKEAKTKTITEYDSLITKPSPYTSDLLQTNFQFGISLSINRIRIKRLYESISSILIPSLAKPFSDLIISVNTFFTELAKNLGVWYAVIESKQQAMPACVSDKTQFVELCRIAAKVLEEKGSEMAPFLKQMQEASNEVIRTIINLNSMINDSLDSPEMQKALSDTVAQIESLNQKILDLKKEKHQVVLCQQFLQQNRENIKRQTEYLTQRLDGLRKEIESLETKIVDAIASERSTTVTNNSSSGWWIFKNHSSSSTTTTVNANSSGLKARKELLESEIAKVIQQMNDLTSETKKPSDVGHDDTSGYDDRIKVAEDDMKKLQINLNAKREALLSNKLATANVGTDVSKKILEVIMTLSTLSEDIGKFTGLLDATRLDVLQTLRSTALDPAIVLKSTSYMFKYAVMFNAYACESFGMLGGMLFDSSYTQYLGNVTAVTVASMKMEQISVEKVIAKDKEISNSKSMEAMALSLFI